jgi:hypothetical protein
MMIILIAIDPVELPSFEVKTLAYRDSSILARVELFILRAKTINYPRRLEGE